MPTSARSVLSLMLCLTGALAACSNDAPERPDVAATSLGLSAADTAPPPLAAAAAAPAAAAAVPLTPAEVAARAAIAVESADELTGAARKQYFQAQRDAARKALMLQRRAIQRAEQGRKDSAAGGADTATLSSIDSELGQLKDHMRKLETKLQKFEQSAAL